MHHEVFLLSNSFLVELLITFKNGKSYTRLTISQYFRIQHHYIECPTITLIYIIKTVEKMNLSTDQLKLIPMI